MQKPVLGYDPAVPGAVEFAQVEARISRMTDAELVEMNDHPEDFEPWALELGRAELARRGLPAEQVLQLRSENAAEETKATLGRNAASGRLIAWALPLVALLALPLIGVIRSAISRHESKGLSETCAQMLARAAGGIAVGNAVKLDDHSLVTNVAIEQIREHPSGAQTAAGIGVMFDVDGNSVPALTTGSVGIDSTREGALGVAIEEWVTGYGMPIVNALARKGKTLRVGAFDVYPGPTGIRGSDPEHLENLHETFFQEVGSALPQLVSGPSLHALSILVVRRPDGSLDGEFRVDGQPSDRLKQLALRAKWPKSEDTYMLKQYYVLTAAGGGDPAR